MNPRCDQRGSRGPDGGPRTARKGQPTCSPPALVPLSLSLIASLSLRVWLSGSLSLSLSVCVSDSWQGQLDSHGPRSNEAKPFRTLTVHSHTPRPHHKPLMSPPAQNIRWVLLTQRIRSPFATGCPGRRDHPDPCPASSPPLQVLFCSDQSQGCPGPGRLNTHLIQQLLPRDATSHSAPQVSSCSKILSSSRLPLGAHLTTTPAAPP